MSDVDVNGRRLDNDDFAFIQWYSLGVSIFKARLSQGEIQGRRDGTKEKREG
jgi:hypothetical protein